MESQGMSPEHREDLAAELREAEKGAAAPYVIYPEPPAWYEPAVGAWFAAFLAAFSLYRDSAVHSVLLVALIVVELVFIRWMSKAHGAMPWPGFGKPPPEIKRVWNAYFLGCLVGAALVALAWWQLGLGGAVPASFVVVTGGLIWYNRSYAGAAERVKERLS